MKKKNLPIKIFEKRLDVDDRQTEAGGSDQPPKWVLSGPELKTKSEILTDELQIAETRVNEKFRKYDNIPVVFKAKLVDDAIAKSHRSELTQFFHAKKLEKTIGFSENQELLIRIDKPTELKQINKNMQDYAKNAKAISGIEGIEVLEPFIDIQNSKLQKDGKHVLKIKLLDYNNYQINLTVLKEFTKLLSTSTHLHLDKTVKYSDHLTIHQISTDSLDALHELDDFSAILSIEPMPTIDVVDDDFFVEETIQVPAPMVDVQYPVVGILDTGIADIPQLKHWIVGRHTNYPEHYIDPSHGTFVAGVVCFGDLLENQTFTGSQGLKLFDARVYPNTKVERITEADLVDNVREVVEAYGEKIKIWNMSLGSKTEVKQYDFSDFGVALDNIQDENDVLIIKSAGNCNNFLTGGPVSKIARGADSVRSLTIGSIAHTQKTGDIARFNNSSPFSRIGPGPSNIIKPDLVHYGGNCRVDANGNLVKNGVRSFKPDGNIKRDIGTSFSTPRITALTADLNNKLGENFDPILLKSLIIHSAKYPSEVSLPINEKVNQLGFGIPSSVDDILYNSPHEITLILRDSLNKGEFIEVLDFPYPNSLIDDDGNYYGQIRLSVINNPILVEGQGPEYCQSNIDVKFGTYDQKTKRDTSKRNIRNPIGRDGGHNLLNSSNYSKKKPTENLKQFTLTEKMLVQYGDKFYPNKKYSLDLSELTPSKKDKFLQSPKRWYLKITGLYREFIEAKEEIERMGLSQEFCILITIRDPFMKKPVYNEVTQLLSTNNFVHRNIKIRQDININLDNEE
ncbi:S8 family peptidase [Brevibacillus laterosporus]|uniref:S8 family peptidase n=1 Tax=Brevibacillus laterosporus TaxID=1465 RepID=UPI003D1D4C4D